MEPIKKQFRAWTLITVEEYTTHATWNNHVYVLHLSANEINLLECQIKQDLDVYNANCAPPSVA